MHKLLARQLAHQDIDGEDLSPQLQELLQAVDTAYQRAEYDHQLMEQSLENTSRELVIQNQRLQLELKSRKETELALRQSEERYFLAVEGSNVGIWDWDVTTGAVYYSPAVLKILGRTDYAGFDTTESWLKYVADGDRHGLRQAIKTHLLGKTSQLEFEYQIRRDNGELRWVVSRGLALRGESGRAYRIAGSIEDITDRKQAEDQIRFDAIHDVLTGLPNRVLLLDRIQHQIENIQRYPEARFAILFLDIDRFKLINDSFGHLTGDQLLVEISRRLKTCIKVSDTLARLGGDEFVILLEDITGESGAEQVAERLLSQLKQPFFLEGNEIFTSSSIGVVLNHDHHCKAEDLLRDADTAMYRAKTEGKGCYRLFDARMHEHAVTRLHLEAGLRRAFEANEFEIYYQPFFGLGQQKLCGFEALIRWQHPQKGVLLPSEFMGVAEEIGLLAEMDRWVLREACHQLQEWNSRFPQTEPLCMSVNISARLFDQHDLPEYLASLLAETGVDSSLLQLEITESCLALESNDRVVTQLLQLKSLGVQLYLDNFGTGYASLSYLHRLPFDGLKVDCSFIANIGISSSDKSFVKVIFDLAESLDLRLIAEGIETQEQLQDVRTLSSCYGQGFLFFRPMSKTSVGSFISDYQPGMFCEEAS
ncbi:MAG: EAL domain-containing protein [Gammaproteobacteria bacterium]|nr:EAL domain-containing protein [Gammaproteobacteria bacterium]